jgi:hypothetical protein
MNTSQQLEIFSITVPG